MNLKEQSLGLSQNPGLAKSTSSSFSDEASISISVKDPALDPALESALGINRAYQGRSEFACPRCGLRPLPRRLDSCTVHPDRARDIVRPIRVFRAGSSQFRHTISSNRQPTCSALVRTLISSEGAPADRSHLRRVSPGQVSQCQ